MTIRAPRGPVISIITLDSITQVRPQHRGMVVVTGSHGGVNVARMAGAGGVLALIANDAGTTVNRSGSAVLAIFELRGGAACTVGYETARIGDGSDALNRGRISGVNAVAARLGCRAGQPCRAAAELLVNAPPPAPASELPSEGRYLLRNGPIPVWGLDSISLTRADDAGAVLVAGSHGGLLGGRPETALKGSAVAVVFHDAGLGKDNAGISRLGALQARGIAAAAVSADTALIGDSRSMWATGVLSAANDTAIGLGIRVGMSVAEFAGRAAAHRSDTIS
jgi:hypothetical protein